MNKKKHLIVITLLISLSFIFFKTVEVPLAVEKTDEFYIQKILARNYPKRSEIRSFSEELQVIQSVMRDILRLSIRKGIPYGSPREPKDLYNNQGGACYDISRTIEKTFRMLGFNIRHAATYYLNGESKLKALTTPQQPSHATSEIQTRKGWMVLDPFTWELVLDHNQNPISLRRAQQEQAYPPFKKGLLLENYGKPFTYVYGLYSRHGKFYPPFISVPNVNWKEFLHNFS